jgi:tyrosyl-tRNA synthetase
MSVPDELIPRYLQYACFERLEHVQTVRTGLADGSLHPRTAKVDLAMRIVARYHGADAATAALAEFERVFVKKDVPDEIDEVILDLETPELAIVDVLTATSLVASKGEARRLIQGGGVKIDGEKVSDITAVANFTEPRIVRAGKLKFIKVSVRRR